MLTSNHISVSICYGYRRLVLKRRKPRWGNFLYKLSICVYIGIEIGKSIHSFSILSPKARWRLWFLLCPKSDDSCLVRSIFSFYFIVIICHFLKYLIKYISLLVNFFRHTPHLHPRSVKVKESCMKFFSFTQFLYMYNLCMLMLQQYVVIPC